MEESLFQIEEVLDGLPLRCFEGSSWVRVFADLVLQSNHFTDNQGSLYTLTVIVVVQSPAAGFPAVALKEGGGSACFSPRMNWESAERTTTYFYV